MTKTNLEKTLAETRARAEAEVREKHPDVEIILVSCWGTEVYLDCKTGDGWLRYAVAGEED